MHNTASASTQNGRHIRGIQFFETETGFFEQRLLQDDLGAGLDGLAYQHLGVGKAGLQIGCARHPDSGKMPG
ncbi:hypothetical protein EGI20_14520 [Aquitalea sp. S1-19]|nr:hypothetical protein [Aquitalea sp. S1-19]